IRIGTLRILKWPGAGSALRGISPGGPLVSSFFTEATSNLRGCAHESQAASANRLATILAWFIGHLLPQRRIEHGTRFAGVHRKAVGRLVHFTEPRHSKSSA